MKTAKFTFKEGNTCIFGSVTLKNDGKISVNLSNGMRYSPNMRYKAKNLGNAIASADFIHPEVFDFKEVKSFIDSKLVAELYKHTTELKNLYIERTKKYADSAYKRAEEREKWSTEQWYDHYDLKYTILHAGTSVAYPKLEHNYSHTTYGFMLTEQSEVRTIMALGLEKFKAKEVKSAEEHYKSSIDKLAMRLNNKGITDDVPFTVTSGVINMNFECIITHPLGITKAWTIIAEGPIQKPHYRYLVK